MVVGRSSHYAATVRPSSRESVKVVDLLRTPLSILTRSYVVVPVTCSRALTSLRVSTPQGSRVLARISRQGMREARKNRPCHLQEEAADLVVVGRRTTCPLLVEDRGEDPRIQETRKIVVPPSRLLGENMVVAGRGQPCQGSIGGRTARDPA